MWSARVCATLLVAASASDISTSDMQKLGQLAQSLHQRAHELGMMHYKNMVGERRLQSSMDGPFCWDDCKGFNQSDSHTVCAKPERCEGAKDMMADSCIQDCTATRMETMIMCENKQFCVDQQAEGACPTTLGLVQGQADSASADGKQPGPCKECAEFSAKQRPVMEMAGYGTMDLSVSKMIMGMVTEDNCPNTIAHGECVLANADCKDPKKADDGSGLFFTALCGCPCGGKLAKFLWDVEAMQLDACTKAVKDGFKTTLPGTADMGPLLFKSGVLECLGCPDNLSKCSASFKKFVTGSMATLVDQLSAMKQACDEEPETTTTTTTTTSTLPPATSASYGTSLLGSIVTVFVAIQLA